MSLSRYKSYSKTVGAWIAAGALQRRSFPGAAPLYYENKYGKWGRVKQNKAVIQGPDTKKMRVLGTASQVKGKIIKEWVLGPGTGLGLEAKKGQVIRVIDLEGQQVIDFVCFNAHDPEEKMWVGSTIINNRSVFFKKGHSLYSQYLNRMFTMIDDTCGVHDLLIGACSPEVFEKDYKVKGHNSCIANFERALAPWGLKRKDIPMNLNIFMNCPIGDDGSYGLDFSQSKRGDFVDMRADMDCTVALSNCPADLSDESGHYLTPVKVILYEPKS